MAYQYAYNQINWLKFLKGLKLNHVSKKGPLVPTWLPLYTTQIWEGWANILKSYFLSLFSTLSMCANVLKARDPFRTGYSTNQIQCNTFLLYLTYSL